METQRKNSPGEPRSAHFQQYPDAIDMMGKDLISAFSRTKEQVAVLVGNMVPKTEMAIEKLPGEYFTTYTGEIADEIHEWPNATLGATFRHLILQFRDNQLMGFEWKFKPVPARPVTKAVPARPPAKPRWKFW